MRFRRHGTVGSANLPGAAPVGPHDRCPAPPGARRSDRWSAIGAGPICRRRKHTPRRAKGSIRVRQLSRSPACDNRARHCRWRCGRADADRWRKVAVLPGAGAAASRLGRRRLTADRIDEGPGRRAAPDRSARRGVELTPVARRCGRDRTRSSQWRARPPLRVSRAADHATMHRASFSLPPCSLCRRRGALHLAMGP